MKPLLLWRLFLLFEERPWIPHLNRGCCSVRWTCQQQSGVLEQKIGPSVGTPTWLVLNTLWYAYFPSLAAEIQKTNVTSSRIQPIYSYTLLSHLHFSWARLEVKGLQCEVTLKCKIMPWFKSFKALKPSCYSKYSAASEAGIFYTLCTFLQGPQFAVKACMTYPWDSSSDNSHHASSACMFSKHVSLGISAYCGVKSPHI